VLEHFTASGKEAEKRVGIGFENVGAPARVDNGAANKGL
jgi:hypothetical protein